VSAAPCPADVDCTRVVVLRAERTVARRQHDTAVGASARSVGDAGRRRALLCRAASVVLWYPHAHVLDAAVIRACAAVVALCVGDAAARSERAATHAGNAFVARRAEVGVVARGAVRPRLTETLPRGFVADPEVALVGGGRAVARGPAAHDPGALVVHGAEETVVTG